jgi:hypothetical protein
MRQPGTKKRPTWVFVAFLFAQLVVLLLLLELGLALFKPVAFRRPLPAVPDNIWTGLLHRKSKLPGLSYELTPNTSGEIRGAKIHINSLGFRGREYSFVKPPNTVRIVAMGASVAFGWTVNDDESYPQRLEYRLNERAKGTDRHYEVFNFGVGGYATRDEVAALETKALALNPDLVIIDFHPNGPESEPIQPLHQVFHEPEWWERWNVLRLIAFGKRRFDIWRLGGGEVYRYLASPRGKHWPTLIAAYDKARALCEPRGIPVIVTIFPTLSKGVEWTDYEFADIHAQVTEAVKQHGFIPVDILPVFARSGLNIPAIAADSEHPNAAGLDLAAAELERVIVARHQELLHLPPPGPAPAAGENPPR